MGMNMVTIASAKVADLIAEATGARLVALSGNMCTDKKPAAINLVRGRGRSVAAGVALPDALISDVFKTDAATLAEVNMRKNLVGSARAGSLGFNAHAANIIAGIFIACGQDPAHVVEGSSAITTVDVTPGGVYVAVTLPSLPIGTVGGGTGLDTQRECLALLGVAGGGYPAGFPCTEVRRDHRGSRAGRGTVPARCTRRTAPGACPPVARAEQTEPFHHDDGVLSVGIVPGDLEDLPVPEPAVKDCAARLDWRTSSWTPEASSAANWCSSRATSSRPMPRLRDGRAMARLQICP